MGADMNGLTNKEVIQSRNKYGRNTLTKVKKRSLFSLILSSLRLFFCLEIMIILRP